MAHNGTFRFRSCFAFGLAGFLATSIFAGEALFPSPLHLTRRITDPLAGSASVVVEEYCSGNRVVTIYGLRTVIVDYSSQQLTEIDRAGGTYSVTRFDEIARAGSRLKAQASATTGESRRAVPLGRRPSARGNAVEAFEISGDESSGRRVIGFDTTLSVSRAAFDALMGASYPSDPRPDHDALVTAAARGTGRIQSDGTARGEVAQYAIPVEQTLELEAAGQTLVTSNVVVRIASELPPLELLAIPPGSKQVESRLTAVPRALRELDRLPGRPTP